MKPSPHPYPQFQFYLRKFTIFAHRSRPGYFAFIFVFFHVIVRHFCHCSPLFLYPAETRPSDPSHSISLSLDWIRRLGLPTPPISLPCLNAGERNNRLGAWAKKPEPHQSPS